MIPKLRYSDAYRLAKAEADKQCKEAGRERWNDSDFRCAVVWLSEHWAAPDHPCETAPTVVHSGT